MYEVSRLVTMEKTSTRILLTKKNYDGVLNKVNTTGYGTPFKFENRGHHEAISCLHPMKNGLIHQHEVQYGIEVSSSKESVDLYVDCEIIPTDHSQANKLLVFGDEVHCVQYNSKGNKCPFPYTAHETMSTVLKWRPIMVENILFDLLDDENSSDESFTGARNTSCNSSDDDSSFQSSSDSGSSAGSLDDSFLDPRLNHRRYRLCNADED